MYQHKDPIYYTFGAGQKNYQCHGTDGLVSLAPLWMAWMHGMYYLTLQRNITEKYKLYINMAYSLSERLVYEIDKHSEF